MGSDPQYLKLIILLSLLYAFLEAVGANTSSFYEAKKLFIQEYQDSGEMVGKLLERAAKNEKAKSVYSLLALLFGNKKQAGGSAD